MNNELQFVVDFYQKSWDNLLWIIGIFFVVLGIIWPTFIFIFNREKSKNYEKNIDSMFKERKKEWDNYITESTKKIDEKSKTLDERMSKIENNEIRLHGYMLFTSAQATNDTFQKMFGFLNAFINFVKAESVNHMVIVYSNMSPYFQRGQTLLTNNTISIEQKQILVNIVEDVINTLKQNSEKVDSKTYIGVFEDFKKQLLNI